MQTSVYQSILEKVSERIAPSWSLKNFVAVNPYSGFTATTFSKTAQLLSSRAGIKITMPFEYYLDHVRDGVIQEKDIRKALGKSDLFEYAANDFLSDVRKYQKTETSTNRNYNLVDIASIDDSKNWNDVLIDRVSFWISAHFDRHVGLWAQKKSTENLYKSWLEEAQVDLTPEIMGLKGFRKAMGQLPENHLHFIDQFISSLKLDESETEAYLHALLLKILGWSSYLSGLDFQSSLYGEKKSFVVEFIAVLLTWENYFINFSAQKDQIKSTWYQRWNSGEPLGSQSKWQQLALIFQDALDYSAQRKLKHTFNNHRPEIVEKEVKAQMVFCIDVRSEVYRRNVELVDPNIETFGFAGFFGFPIAYNRLGLSEGQNQCPVLIPSSAQVNEKYLGANKEADRRISEIQVSKTWKKFKSGAITSFGFVSPLGLAFLPKILLKSFHQKASIFNPLKQEVSKWNKKGRILDLSEIPMTDKVSMAMSALQGIGLKDNFAALVLFVGHGSSSVNNPHASGLDCGACGGHSGEVNALTAQYILNDLEVRKRLTEHGINIPKGTLLLACLHNTTTDEITFTDDSCISEELQKDLAELKKSLFKASEYSRLERTIRLNIQENSDKKLNQKFEKRAKDWAQVRPEWGLAGCHSFIVAPRIRTKGMKLEGKSFLHNYNWNDDPEFKVLESIMTAPMVVTSWINLQYYASTTDNSRFGAGNKTLHNVTSGIGVIEGSGGDLRIGLPLQSVHSGEKFEHTPIRLNVVIEAPIEAINRILEKHDHIRLLFENKWIFLHHMNKEGKINYTYNSNFKWANEEKVIQEMLKSSIV